MKRIILISILALIGNLWCLADVNTDRTMSRILRDTKTYISAEARAATEDNAYDMALKSLTGQITDYLKEKDGVLPDAVYLKKVSSIYDKISNQISTNRYRVVLYVKKSDLRPMADIDNAIVLARDNEGNYESVQTSVPDKVIVTDTLVRVVTKPVAINPVISNVAQCESGKKLPELLKSLRDSNKITGASAFPIARLNDFFVAVINRNNEIISVLRHTPDGWINAQTLESVDPLKLNDCTAYWFTLTE